MPNVVAEVGWRTFDRTVAIADYVGDLLTNTDPVQQTQLASGERSYRLLALEIMIEDTVLDKTYEWVNKRRNR